MGMLSSLTKRYTQQAFETKPQKFIRVIKKLPAPRELNRFQVKKDGALVSVVSSALSLMRFAHKKGKEVKAEHHRTKWNGQL